MVEGHPPDCNCIECRMERMEKQMDKTRETIEMILELLKRKQNG